MTIKFNYNAEYTILKICDSLYCQGSLNNTEPVLSMILSCMYICITLKNRAFNTVGEFVHVIYD